MIATTRQVQELADVLDTFPVPTWLLDESSRTTRFNEQWLRYAGREAVHRPGWLSEQFVHPADRPRVHRIWKRARARHERFSTELRLRRFDGAARWHQANIEPIADENGRVHAWLGTCIDIDDQHRRVDHLEQERLVLQAQGEASLDAIILISPDRRLIWANRRARELWGVDEHLAHEGEDMRSVAEISAHHARDPDAHLAALDRIYAEPFAVVHDDLAMADGRFMERFSAPVISHDGSLLGRINTYRDVTARVQLVDELEREREQLQSTLHQVNSLVRVLKGLATASALANDASLTLVQVLAAITDQARILTNSTRAVTRVVDPTGLIHIIESPDTESGEPEPDPGVTVMMQAPLVAIDGEQLGYIQVLGVADAEEYAESGQSVLVQVAQMAASAIQSRRLVETLRDRARTALVLNHIADAVFVTGTDHVVHLWNPAAELLTGLPSALVVGHPIGDVVPGWHQLAERIPVFDASSRHRSTRTLPLESARGEVWISIVGVAYDQGIVYAARDVTDEHRIERLRSDIVATVSHELRTPLTSIYGMAVTLQRPDEELPGAARHELVDVIVDQSARLGAIIEDILVASSLEAGSFDVQQGEVDSAQVVREMLDTVARNLPGGITVAAEPIPDDLRVSGDIDRVRQVLGNLLDNAIKYSPNGGHVAIRVRADGETVELQVHDEGLGIPALEHERIFEKFHRLDPKMTLGIPGTGLGLYIARELMRRMGGNLTVQSSLGRGSTFTMTLPRA